MRHILKQPLYAVVRKEFLGSTEDSVGSVIAVEFYAGSIPTLTFQSKAGHIFAYLPPNAFSYAAERYIKELVDIECPNEVPNVFELKIEDEGTCLGAGFGKVDKDIVTWQDYICSADWANNNLLVHCVRLYDGSYAFLRNSRFQIGGTKWNPPDWKKLRNEWKLS